MLNATATPIPAAKARRPAASKATPAAVDHDQPSPPTFPQRHGLSKALPFGEVDRFTRDLHQVHAVLKMINRIMCEDVELSGDLKLVDGLMGSVQYAYRTLGGLNDVIQESEWEDVPDLYWGVFQAYSLVSLLERLEFDDGFEWRASNSIYFDFISAATCSIQMALVVLEGGAA